MKGKLLQYIKQRRYLYGAFFLPVFILVLVFALTDIYPFGEQQLAIIDMYHQYVPFLGELQYRLHGGGSLFYSWNSGGGCNFWCLMSYYGASPLNLLLILFPASLLMEGVSVIILIKIGLAGSFMYIYLRNVYNPSELLADRQGGAKTMLFAIMYALCSYSIGYYWCLMWLDAVMLLPLCMLGLNRLIKDGRMALYSVTLAIIVFSNYYIAIMVCIFILLYYPVYYFITVRDRGHGQRQGREGVPADHAACSRGVPDRDRHVRCDAFAYVHQHAECILLLVGDAGGVELLLQCSGCAQPAASDGAPDPSGRTAESLLRIPGDGDAGMLLHVPGDPLQRKNAAWSVPRLHVLQPEYQ